MIPPRHADRLFGGILLMVGLVLGWRVGVEVWMRYHPIARVTVEQVIDPAPVRAICEYIPEHRGCPEAKKEGK